MTHLHGPLWQQASHSHPLHQQAGKALLHITHGLQGAVSPPPSLPPNTQCLRTTTAAMEQETYIYEWKQRNYKGCSRPVALHASPHWAHLVESCVAGVVQELQVRRQAPAAGVRHELPGRQPLAHGVDQHRHVLARAGGRVAQDEVDRCVQQVAAVRQMHSRVDGWLGQQLQQQNGSVQKSWARTGW